jgi:hypothetical protein
MSRPTEIVIIAVVAVCTIGRLVYQFRFVRGRKRS